MHTTNINSQKICIQKDPLSSIDGQVSADKAGDTIFLDSLENITTLLLSSAVLQHGFHFLKKCIQNFHVPTEVYFQDYWELETYYTAG